MLFVVDKGGMNEVKKHGRKDQKRKTKSFLLAREAYIVASFALCVCVQYIPWGRK
jgi:hypothetical protein